MGFLFHAVAPPLSAHINFLYQWQGPIPFARDAIFPMPAIDLKFNLGDPWRVRGPREGSPAMVCDQSWCVGIWNRHHIIEWPRLTQFLGVSFKPEGAHIFLDVPLDELHNAVVPLEGVWGRLASEVSERLHDARSAERRFAIVEEVLLARFLDQPAMSPVAVHAAKAITDRHGALRIGELCDELGVSRKHLITLFKRFVGCTPKEFARLHRFGHTLTGIDATAPVDWTTVAHDNDYFDQSHFSREFEAYTGLSPGAYLRLRRSVGEPDHIGIPGVVPAG
jgi:AraC-like DNA-binding protein